MTNALLEIAEFNAQYVRCIDHDELESWPDLFSDNCFYKVTTRDNVRKGYMAGLMYLTNKGMMTDRINSMRQANVFEAHRYRHVIGFPTAIKSEGAQLSCEIPFVVVRIMRDGKTELFASGDYHDVLVRTDGDSLLLRERIVVCDSSSVDTMMIIPL